MRRAILAVLAVLAITVGMVTFTTSTAQAAVIDYSCDNNIDPGSTVVKQVLDSVSANGATTYLFWGKTADGRAVEWAYVQGSVTEFGLDWSDYPSGYPNNWHYCWNGPNGGWPATYAVETYTLYVRCFRVAMLKDGVWYHNTNDWMCA